MSQDWWNRQIKGTPPPPREALPPTPVARPTYQQPVAPARPARPESRCPECGSGNFLTKGTPRCFDCGYVQGRDFQNSTQGMISDSSIPTEAAPGQNTDTSYDPTNIQGRIG